MATVRDLMERGLVACRPETPIANLPGCSSRTGSTRSSPAPTTAGRLFTESEVLAGKRLAGNEEPLSMMRTIPPPSS